MRAALRGLGWLISELIPAQAVRAARGRDYADALTRAEAENEVWEEHPVWRHPLADWERELLLEACVPSGCQCSCHRPGSMSVSHVVACCSEAPLLQPAEPGGEVVSALPPAPTSPPLSWVDWASPAVMDVLADHVPVRPHPEAKTVRCQSGDVQPLVHSYFPDWQAWRQHVAPLIAERLETATLNRFQK